MMGSAGDTAIPAVGVEELLKLFSDGALPKKARDYLKLKGEIDRRLAAEGGLEKIEARLAEVAKKEKEAHDTLHAAKTRAAEIEEAASLIRSTAEIDITAKYQAYEAELAEKQKSFEESIQAERDAVKRDRDKLEADIKKFFDDRGKRDEGLKEREKTLEGRSRAVDKKESAAEKKRAEAEVKIKQIRDFAKSLG